MPHSGRWKVGQVSLMAVDRSCNTGGCGDPSCSIVPCRVHPNDGRWRGHSGGFETEGSGRRPASWGVHFGWYPPFFCSGCQYANRFFLNLHPPSWGPQSSCKLGCLLRWIWQPGAWHSSCWWRLLPTFPNRGFPRKAGQWFVLALWVTTKQLI